MSLGEHLYSAELIGVHAIQIGFAEGHIVPSPEGRGNVVRPLFADLVRADRLKDFTTIRAFQVELAPHARDLSRASDYVREFILYCAVIDAPDVRLLLQSVRKIEDSCGLYHPVGLGLVAFHLFLQDYARANPPR